MLKDINFLETIQAKLCKGKGYPHYILPAYYSPKLCETLGYCKPCWMRQLIADNYGSMTSLPKTKPFKDSKINPGSGPCSNETL